MSKMGKLEIDDAARHGATKKYGFMITVVTLACCCAIGLLNFTLEEDNHGRHGASQMARLEDEFHRKLDAAFEESKQQVDEESLLSPQELLTDSTIVSDGGSNEERCSSLGITPESVTKSRIVGNTNRWNKVIERIRDGQKIKIGVLGGSVPWGSGCTEHGSQTPRVHCAWPHHLETMMNEYYSDARLEVVNLAQPGTPSSSGITLVMDMTDYDAIIIQYTTNDDWVQEEQVKPAFETLIRSALSLPRNPAVILFEGLGRAVKRPNNVPIGELSHYAIGSVYEIPIVSARAAFWREKTFNRNDWSGSIGTDPSIHPKGVWHQRLACLMYKNWVHESEHPLDMSQWRDPLDQEPIYGGDTMGCTKKYSASSFEESLEQAPSTSEGWSYYADAPNKYGYISNATGSVLVFDIPHDSDLENQVLFVKFLRSYTPEWGTAAVWTGSEDVKGRKPAAIIDSRSDAKSQISFIKLSLDSLSKEPYKVHIENFQGKVKIVEVLLYSCQM